MVLETNGVLDEPKQTVEWKYSMLDVMTGAPTVPPVLRAEVRRMPGPLFWAGAIGSLLAVLLVAKAIFGRKC